MKTAVVLANITIAKLASRKETLYFPNLYARERL
jgi:hypothetical protein